MGEDIKGITNLERRPLQELRSASILGPVGRYALESQVSTSQTNTADKQSSVKNTKRIAVQSKEVDFQAPPDPKIDWRDRAACLREDPELFFPIGNTGPAILQIEEAKAVCRRCDVVDICLKWALDSDQDDGIWGGMSKDERRALKRRAARARRAN